MPSSQALPLSALILYLITLIVFERDPNLVHTAVFKGLLIAWTPILIIAGAIFLFRTMEASGSLTIIRSWLNTISENSIAQLMIVAWSFQFLIEGASGFGTPAALAAPILVGLGFPAVRVAIVCLILNSVPVSFGAVGTPTWFGFSGIDTTVEEMMAISFKSALLNASISIPIVFIALSFIVKLKSLIENALFIVLSICACVLPYVLIAQYSFEFPALIGGLLGLIMTLLLAHWNIGLSKRTCALQTAEQTAENIRTPNTNKAPVNRRVSMKSLIKASFPLWGTVLLLVLTRIPQLGIKPLLQLQSPSIAFDLGGFGVLSVSPALVVSLTNIFNTSESWQHSLLYVPSILPFGFIALLTFYLSRSQSEIKTVLVGTVKQMHQPLIALIGALIFVNLMMMGNEGSAVTMIGKHLASLTGQNWQIFAAYLGALGSFFSGSATISNLTFAGIQDAIATNLNLNRSTLLALQSVGGAIGNMVCINNIVAVASVLGLQKQEGYILKRTSVAMLVCGLTVGVLSLLTGT